MHGKRRRLWIHVVMAFAAGLLACARAGTHPASTSAGVPAPASSAKNGAKVTDQPVSSHGGIDGLVKDSEGRTVPDALVAVIAAGGRREAKLMKSDRDGRFSIEGLTAGSYVLTATASGRVGAYQQPVQVAAGAFRAVELRMEGEALTLRGSLADRSGGPVGNAIIRATRLAPFLGHVFVGRSDSSGAFAVTVPKGRYLVAVDAGDLAAAQRSVEGSGDVAVQFELVPSFAADKPPPREVTEWLRANAIPLATPEAGHGFEDLQPLRQVVGNARVVALGEATHGTREFFQLKHRILEFLATEKGFTVFGIEASYPEALAVNDYVLNGSGDPAAALGSMRFWTWDTEEVLEQIRWMRGYNEDRSHQAKLEFYGFDMQSPSGAVQQVLEYLQKVDLALARKVAPIVAPLDNDFDHQDYAQLPKARIAETAEGLARILKQLDDAKAKYVRRSSLSEWMVARMNARVAIQGEENARKRSPGFRDRSMAENIKALLDQQRPGARMVVWAHNGHVSKEQSDTADSMGSHLARMLGSEMVVFGFAFNEGSFQAMQLPFGRGGVTAFTLPPAPPGSLDASLATAGKLFAIDLRRAPSNGIVSDWLNSPLAHRQIGATFSNEVANAVLSDVFPRRAFDALLFVDKTSSARATPSGKRSDAPFAFRKRTAGLPVNLDFEEADADGKLTGWISDTGSEKGSYAIASTDSKPFRGSRCASIIRDRAPWRWGYGSLFQFVKAAPYHGKRIRFRAAARAETSGIGNRSELFVKVVGARLPRGQENTLSFASTLDHPIDSTWRLYQVEASVPGDAEGINVGFVLAGNGRAWFDDASIEIIGDATAPR